MQRLSTPFLHPDFLLQTEEARRLYHDHAAGQPIIDYHCHLPPQDVAGDRRFENLFRIWLAGDHYKWRAMRTNGVVERLCTGDASDKEKYLAWAATVPKCLRNPLYHWTHLELNRPFGINDRLLSPETAESIWNDCNAKLATEDFSALGIMRQMKVELICTTDDPADNLEHHIAHAAKCPQGPRMLPTFRPDKAMNLEDLHGWNTWVDKLALVVKREIRTMEDLLAALEERHTFFHNLGCRLSDHALEAPMADLSSESHLGTIFRQARAGQSPETQDIRAFKTHLMLAFGEWNYRRGWTMQLHMGVIRNNNSRLFKQLGPDTGFDSIGDAPTAKPLARLLDLMDRKEALPRTILYNINPADNEILATMLGNFQDGSIPGKMQFGSAWWFLDQWDGMTKQMDALSNLGLLSRFVGMLTDSRSFLSYTRHEYFRRLLCDMLGRDMKEGRIPRDWNLVGGMVEDISYRNAKNYFGFDKA
jgi:glucuronate isomerase